MREIMISIQPQWVEKILGGEKTIEIRKTMPKCELPVKVYIYETKRKYKKGFYNNLDHKVHYCEYFGKGKVVAEFTLNKVDEFHISYEAKYLYDALNSKNQNILKQSCLDIDEMLGYLKDKYYGYAWHIDNLKIYDKPKELKEFLHNVPDYSNGVVMYSLKPEPLKRPPQSWCYVEGVSNE